MPDILVIVTHGPVRGETPGKCAIDDAHAGIRPVISEVLINLYERLMEAGIEIPFPQQDIHIKDVAPLTILERNM